MTHFFVALFSLFLATHHEVADEPTGPLHHSPPARVREMDRAQPGFVTFYGGSGIRRYVGDMQAVACDDYPAYTFTSPRADIRDWTGVVRRCVHAAPLLHLPRPLMVMQGFGGLRDGPFIWRCPTTWERWKMIRVARNLGAGGVLIWRPRNKRLWC